MQCWDYFKMRMKLFKKTLDNRQVS